MTRLLGKVGTERLFVGYFGWRSARFETPRARALPAGGVPQSGAPPSATMRRSPTPLPPNLPRCESALLALPRERKGGYRADTDIGASPSPFEEMARLARRLDVLGGDEEDATTTDHSHHRRDIDDDLANAWTVARRLAEGRAELRPALTLLAQCMEQRARLVRRRMDARVRCAGELLARVMEVRATADRVERALEDTGLLTPARRACGIDDASPGEKTHPSSQHVHACATYDEEVRAINEGRRRPSALPAPLGITPPVTASDPNNKRARRDDDDDDETERRRKQRREFSFDLVTPTLSTTPDEGDEEEDEKECDEASQPEPMPTSEDPEDPDDTAAVSHEDHEEATTIKETQDDVLGSDEDVERGDDEDRELEGEVLVTTDCQKLLPADSDGEDSGYSAEGELSLSVTASLSAFAKQHGGGTQSQ